MMTSEERVDILLDALIYYGFESQAEKAVEEMSELIQALCKHKRHVTVQSTINVIEECADVLITAMQVAVMFGVKDVENMIDMKLKRLKRRMEDEDTETSEVEDFLMENETGDQAGA